MTPRAWLFGALLLAAWPWAQPAKAGPRAASTSSGDQSRAIQLFQEGQQDYDGGDFTGALEKFREVDALLTSPNARLYMARCLRELGRLPEAFELMSETVATSHKMSATDPSYLRTRDAAAAEREAIVPRIGRIVVAANDPPEGIVVMVGARQLALSEIGRELGVEPGRLLVKAEAPGHLTFRHATELEPGSKTTVAIVMTPEGQERGPAGEPPSDAWRTVGFVTMGVGVLGMGLFAVTGLMANDRYATLEEECGRPPCTGPQYQDVVDEGKTLDLLANVGLGVGIGGLVLGTLMVAFGWPSTPDEGTDEAEDGEPSALVEADRSGALVGLRLRF